MPITLRIARADDASAALPLIVSSGPDAFHYVFTVPGRASAADFLRRAFTDGQGQFGYRNHWVAEDGGRVVGIGACYGGEKNAAFLVRNAAQIVARYGAASPGVMLRGLRVETVVRPPARREWTIIDLAVAPERRGGGIGEQLVRHFLAEGKRAGYAKAVLDVSVKNPRAQALYERLGFTVEAERPSALKNDVAEVPGHRRMSRAI